MCDLGAIGHPAADLPYRIAAERCMQVARALTPVGGRLILAVTAAVGLSLFAAWSAFGQTKPLFDARCDTWDAAATSALSDLIADRDPAVEQRLGDALFRLRRARKHCRYGFIGLAQLDYQALLDGRYASRASGHRLGSGNTAGMRGQPVSATAAADNAPGQ
jgi:hypothetical protein